MEDRELIIRAREGDKAAFERLVENYRNRAFSFVLAHLRNLEDARDIVQESFIRIYENLDRIDENRKFFSYFYKTVQNGIYSHLRRKKREKTVPEEAAEDIIRYWNNGQLSTEEKLFLLGALDSLPPEEKNIVILRFFEGMNDGEIAAVTGLTEENVRVKIHRAKKKLSVYLEASHD